MHAKYFIHIGLLFAILQFSACNQPSPDTLFVERKAATTGISFSNDLEENDSLNIIQYLYFYNGGGVAAGDVNNDGLADLYFVSNQSTNRLYLNRGNLQFEDVTEVAGVPGIGNWNTGVSMADINGDGWLDMYVSGVGDYKSFTGRNALYINQKDGTFKEESAAYGLAYQGFGQQALFLDYDRDGDLDCYLLTHSVHAPENYGQGSLRMRPDSLKGDRLLQNNGGVFKDVSQTRGIYQSRIGFGLGIVAGDIDNNGFPDLYVANDFHENDYLYLNQEGTGFKEVLKDASGHTSRFSMGVDMADYDQNGWLDILTLDMKPEPEIIRKSMPEDDPYNIFQAKIDFGYHPQFTHNALQKNVGINAQTDIPQLEEIAQMEGLAATDWSWSTLFVDADNDGDEDIWVTNGILRRPTDLDYLNFLANDQVQQEASDLEIAQGMPDGAAPNYFFQNTEGHFADRSDSSGLNTVGYTQGAAWVDLDNDGDLDLVANHLNRPASIYENQQNTGHFLRLRLTTETNTWGIGARVQVYAGN
ncbi:MAG: VCBS repeat-containing protein, partial [Bacteroidota bacterium]